MFQQLKQYFSIFVVLLPAFQNVRNIAADTGDFDYCQRYYGYHYFHCAGRKKEPIAVFCANYSINCDQYSSVQKSELELLQPTSEPIEHDQTAQLTVSSSDCVKYKYLILSDCNSWSFDNLKEKCRLLSEKCKPPERVDSSKAEFCSNFRRSYQNACIGFGANKNKDFCKLFAFQCAPDLRFADIPETTAYNDQNFCIPFSKNYKSSCNSISGNRNDELCQLFESRCLQPVSQPKDPCAVHQKTAATYCTIPFLTPEHYREFCAEFKAQCNPSQPSIFPNQLPTTRPFSASESGQSLGFGKGMEFGPFWRSVDGVSWNLPQNRVEKGSSWSLPFLNLGGSDKQSFTFPNIGDFIQQIVRLLD